MRNNRLSKQQINDSGFILYVFEAGFEDVLKDVQSIYLTTVNGKSDTAI